MLPKRFGLLLITCYALLLASCSDDVLDTDNPEVEDGYVGALKAITLAEGMEEFRQPEFKLVLATESGDKITRTGKHSHIGGESHLALNEGLKSGTYRLLYLSYPKIDEETGQTVWREYGLGCRIEIDRSELTAVVCDTYNPTFKMYGSGTADDPFIVSSSDNLERLRKIANDFMNNRNLTDSTHFKQTADIDMEVSSFYSDKQYGWMPIGSQNTCPFRGIYDGGGHAITGLQISRTSSGGVGLFGYADAATFCNIKMKDATIEGNFATGTLLGAAVTKGSRRSNTMLINCTTEGGYVKAGAGSAAIGGIVGLVDQGAEMHIDSCFNKGTKVNGSYGVGGILGAGALLSRTKIQSCDNIADVTSDFTGCGGIAGSCDSLYVMNSNNHGKVTGSSAYSTADTENSGMGTGGIAGGAGRSYFYTCRNYGEVSGHTGVGGILGSTCSSRELQYFNNAMFRSCGNEAAVSGITSVGGICGEAQFGCYAVYNTGEISLLQSSADAVIGGIVGNTSVSVVHNAVNAGKVKASEAECVGGVVGKTTWGNLIASQNLSEITATAKYVGGIVARAGSQTVINYCSNYYRIFNYGKGYTGGIVGEVGDPREWTTMNTINCIIGGIECVLGVVGPTLTMTGKDFLKESDLLGFLAKSEKWHSFHKVAHVVELAFDISTLAYDWSAKLWGIQYYFTPEELKARNAQFEQEAEKIDAEVRGKISSLRSIAAPDVVMYSGLNTQTSINFMNNVETLVKSIEADNDKSFDINCNMNAERESRMESVESFKETTEIVHKAIGGACLVVSTAAFVVSLAVAPGSQPAFIAAMVGGLSTFIGGANAIVENVDDYQSNMVSITQCANFSIVQADEADYVGGIVGSLEDFGYLANSLNTGALSGSNKDSAGIAGYCGSKSELVCNLNVGSNWERPINSNAGLIVEYVDNVYIYGLCNYQDVMSSSDINPRTLDTISLKSQYSENWDFDSDKSVWKLTEKRGYFPIPYRSSMEFERVEE